MTELLQSRLNRIRARIRQTLLIYGLSWLVAVLFGAVLLFGTLDWLVHIDDSGLRLMIGLTILTATGWIAWRLLIHPLRRKLSDVEIALRIEKRYPGFHDSFASTVQFLRDGESSAVGSPGMQRHVIEHTLREADRVDVGTIVESRGVRRAAWIAIGVCLCVGLVAGLNQTEAATVINRLLFPFGDHPWPKSTKLVLLDEDLKPLPAPADEPLRLARDATLKLFVANTRGGMPSDVKMEYRFSPDETVREPLRRTTIRTDEGRSRELAAAAFVVTKGPLEFRAVGGDDAEMPWRRLEVVPPPLVQHLQLTRTPPAYSKRPQETLPAGTGHVKGLLGTRVEISARVNKPVKYAKLRVKDHAAIPLKLSDDGREFSGSFTITDAGVHSYWFDLRDMRGFENPAAPRYEVRGITDTVPEVWIDEPPTDLQATPTALIPLKVGAKDDLGLKELRLRWTISGQDEPHEIPLYDEPERPLHQTASHTWDLAELKLQPGMQVAFHAEATDDYDLDVPHVGRSITRTLTIVSPRDKQAEIAARQGGIVDDLEDVHDAQQKVREQVDQLLIQLRTAGKLRPQDLDQLKGVELEQRRIATQLNHPVDGVEARTSALRQELKNNRIDDQATDRRLQHIAEEIRILREDHLPAIDDELTLARKGAETKSPADRKPDGESGKQSSPTDEDKQGNDTNSGKPSKSKPRAAKTDDQHATLRRAGEHQQAVLDSMQALLGELREWRSRRDLTADARDLVEEQEKLIKDTGEILKKTGGQPTSPQDRADLEKIAARQKSEADRAWRMAETLRKAAEEAKATNPAMAEALRDGHDHLTQQAIPNRMTEAARELDPQQGNTRLGAAVARQSEVLKELKELEDILHQRGASDTETLVKKLRAAEQELSKLKQEQAEILRKTQDAKQLRDKAEREQALEQLRKEQRELQRKIASMARELRRLEARRSGASLRRSAARMQESVEQLTKENRDAAEQEQQEALDDLEQAQRELAQERQAAEEQLARERMERIADDLKSMIAREQGIIDETNRLEAERRKRNGRLSRAQLASLTQLARIQLALKAETDELAETLKAAEVFALALQGASRDMQRAADRLQAKQTGTRTIDAETAAKNRFVALVKALAKDKQQPQDAAQQPPDAGGPQNAGPQTDGIPQLAQLKMLKALQEDLIRRTRLLDRHRQDTGKLDADQQEELEQLIAEQGQLADLTRNLTRAFAEAFNTEPPEPNPMPPEEAPKKKTKKDELKDLGLDLDLEDAVP